MPPGSSGCASRLQRSGARVSPMPTASPSPGGCGASFGAVAEGGRDDGGAEGAPPRFWMRIDTSAAPTRSAAKIRAAGRGFLDRRVLLVLGNAEGRAAAARGHDVRVVHLEARALQRVDVVDARAVGVRGALVVDEDPQAVVLEDRVAVALVVEGEVILEAGAAAAAHADTQAGDRQVGLLRLEEVADLLGAQLREVDALGVIGDLRRAHRFTKCSEALPCTRSMPTTDEIKQRIESSIPESTAEVEDWTGGGAHFRAHVVSPAFAGLSRIQQHRLVMDVFAGEIGGPIHALSVKTQTP